MATDPYTPINPNWARADPRAAQGELTRKQWELFEREFKPFEDQAIERLLADPEPRVQEAGAQVERSYMGLDAMRDRMLSRYGMRATGDVRAALDRQHNLMRGLDVTRIENSTRAALEDQKIEGLAQMLGLMRGVSSSASQNLSSAASMAAQRDIAARQNAAAERAARNQLLGTAAGIALALANL